MGLLDVFNSYEGQQALGLLAAAGGRSDGAGFGQRLMEGLSQGDKWKAAQAQEEMRKQQMQMQAMQIAEYQQKVADQKRMQEAAMRKQQALPTIFGQSVSAGSASPAMLGDVPMFSGGMNVQKASIAGPTRLDVQRALAAGYSPKEIQELDSLRNVGMDEVARTIDVEGANGGKTVRGLDKFGRQVFDQNGYVAPVSVNQGNQTTFVKPSAGLSLPMGMSPSEKDASARGWASNELANARLGLDREKFKLEQGATNLKTTEGEKTAGTLLQRLRGSQIQLEDALSGGKTGAEKPSVVSNALRGMGQEMLANSWDSPARQKVESAQLDILDAALTLGTGAAYTREQLEGYRKSYFPQIGDSASAVKDKQDRLNNILKAAEIKAGGATKLVPTVEEMRASKGAPSGMQPGKVEDGFRFKGGDPSNPKNWEKL